MTDILNSIVLLLNFVIVPAATYGSQLALGALGVTLIYSVLRYANFAHGETMAFGAMVTILITWLLQSMGITGGFLPTALLALPFGIIATIIFLLLIDKVVYSHYRKKKSASIIFTIASVGVMFVLNGVTRFIIGPANRDFFDGEKYILKARSFKVSTGLAEGLTLKSTQVITVITVIIAVTALFWFLQKTRHGKSMRAYSDNEDLALLSGIEPKRVIFMTWCIAGTLTVLSGVLFGLDKTFTPFIYSQLLLPIFAAVIVGGIGHPVGAIVGGYLIAFSEAFVTYAYKKFFMYTMPEWLQPEGLSQFLSTEYKFAVSFVILVIVLLISPTGIFKGKSL